MYVRMNVGAYKGEIRGPFTVDIARNLIATGQAVEAKTVDGKIAVPIDESQEVAAETAEVKSSEQVHHKNKARSAK
ncbi:MAG TPA: hypothetical protein VKW06_00580 [Candidatus Angelobacter sp.]|nr:hypothetical protein [Candidatus Angelobacter sp.]